MYAMLPPLLATSSPRVLSIWAHWLRTKSANARSRSLRGCSSI